MGTIRIREPKTGAEYDIDDNGNATPVKAANDQPDKVAPYGLRGVITGQGGAEPSAREALVRGGLQGASLGFGDEASALIDTGVSHIPLLRDIAQKFNTSSGGSGGGLPIDNPDLTYQQRRDAYRARNEAAEEAHPVAYGGGELVGGLAAVPFSGGAGEAKGLGAAIKAGAKLGAKVGAATALGKSNADLTEGDVGNALVDTTKGAALGALAGGAVGAAGEGARRVLSGGRDRIRAWVQKDIVGDVRGAATATAKKNLARDAEDIADVVTGDRELETSLRKASHQDTKHLGDAIATVNDRLEKVGAPREGLYQELDQMTGGVRAGDFVDHLEKAIEDRKATGKGHDAGEARELQKVVDRIKGARDWGFKPTLDAQNQQIVANLEKQRAAALDAGRPTDKLDNAIKNVTDTAEPQFDPDHVVSSKELRGIVTDLQNTAFESEGGINGTERFRRAREVSRVPEGFLDELKAKAEKTNPDLIARLDQHDKEASALLRVKNVLEQRFNRAEQDSMGTTGHGIFGRVLHAAAHPKASLTREAVAAGAKGAIATGRAIDRTARAVDERPYLSMVLDGLRHGLTMAAAVEAAQAAGRAGAE